ncbi:MAG TPA: 4'-phosphopantetheinyl transferase superfamily protein [Terriglobia bacterium]|nr:4'-phosphopantetheinyl transferase superfamily protein [Terriglobia bacterium]
MNVYWLLQTGGDLPARTDWLSPAEAAHLSGLRFPKRRADWLLGRWTAKRALAVYLNVPHPAEALPRIEIRSRSSGAPQAFLANEPAAVTLSISHRASTAICAVAPAGASLGCDLEVIETRNDAFVADYCCADERALVASAPEPGRPLLVTLLWSAKESALKALCAGLRLDTRSVVVGLDDPLPIQGQNGGLGPEGAPTGLPAPPGQNHWRALHVRSSDGQIFNGWWQCAGDVVRTLVAAPPPSTPCVLNLPGL